MRRVITTFLLPVLLCGGAEAGVVTISELFYDAVGPDDGLTFIEIYGPPGRILDGVVLIGVNGRDGSETHRFALDGYRVPLDRFLVLADTYSGGGTGVAQADYLIPGMDFQNGPDSVLLRFGGSVLDALGYGEFGLGEVFSGEGRSAADAVAGSSLERRYADLDTDDNLLDFQVSPTPSPGSGAVRGSELVAPESRSLALVGLGLLLVALWRAGVNRREWRSRRERLKSLP